MFGLSGWTVERFRSGRRRLFDLQWQATRLREKSVLWSLLVVVAANASCSGRWRPRLSTAAWTWVASSLSRRRRSARA